MKYIITILFNILALSISAQRIVSLTPSITHTLQQIGIDQKVIGRTSYCPKPLTGNKSEIVGDVLTINIEKIVALKPDIVFTMAFTSKSTIEKLQRLGIQVVEFKTPTSFDEICEQTLFIGDKVNNKKEAIKLVNQERQKVDSIKSSFSNIRAKKIFFEIGTHPLFAAPNGTYIGEFISTCGGENIAGNNSTIISREYIVSRHPEIIFISSMNGIGKKEKDIWSKLTQARILIIDEDKACCPTPTFYRQTLEQLATFVGDNE